MSTPSLEPLSLPLSFYVPSLSTEGLAALDHFAGEFIKQPDKMLTFAAWLFHVIDIEKARRAASEHAETPTEGDMLHLPTFWANSAMAGALEGATAMTYVDSLPDDAARFADALVRGLTFLIGERLRDHNLYLLYV